MSGRQDAHGGAPFVGGDAIARDDATARVRELTLAFALSEIDEAGLAELHALLTGPQGAAMAAAAWQQLDGTVALRSGLGGPAFAEAVRLRLADDGSFARTAKRRLGLRPPLDPVDAPPPRRRRWGRRLAWFGIPMLLAAGLTLLLIRAPSPATVVAVQGLPVAAGAALLPGAGLDPAAPVAVPPGAALAFAWHGGGGAVLAGPASAVVQPRGLLLINGTAWIVAGPAGAQVGTPDRSLALPPHGRLAVLVVDGAAQAGVPAEAPPGAGIPAPGRVATRGGEAAWEPARRVSGAAPLPAAWWELDARVDSWGEGGELRLALDPGPELVLRPTTLTLPGGRVARLDGPPAATRLLTLRLRGRRGEVVVDGGMAHDLLLAEVPAALRVVRAGADGPDPELRIGPPAQPPLPLAGWGEPRESN